MQLASQFNYLESPCPFIAQVRDWIGDTTQGPQGSIEAAAASLRRFEAVTSGKLPHALTDVLPVEGRDTYYQNGYFMPNHFGGDFAKLREYIKTHMGQLKVLPQWVVCEATGSRQLQVFSAAPSFKGEGTPSMDSSQGQISNDIVVAQYDLIGKLAAIQAKLAPSKPVYVHLTRVGQGAFKNPPEIMINAFEAVARTVVGLPNVHVFIHGWSETDQSSIEEALKTKGIPYSDMKKEQFIKGQF